MKKHFPNRATTFKQELSYLPRWMQNAVQVKFSPSSRCTFLWRIVSH